jgi:hypothetical protein
MYQSLDSGSMQPIIPTVAEIEFNAELGVEKCAVHLW